MIIRPIVHQVAIKLLRADATERENEDLASELKLMIHIGRHKNIVNLLGACTIDGPLWLLLEYCHNRSLLEFLRTRSELVPRWNSGVESGIELQQDSLCFFDLMKMCLGICEGELGFQSCILRKSLQILVVILFSDF